MFTSVVTALALAASVSRVAASPVHHDARAHHAQIARGYKQDAEILEDYATYQTRYVALDCQDQRNTDFFEQCCHPLLRTQNLSDRPAQCTPSASASSSAAAAEPSASVIDEDPVYSVTASSTTAYQTTYEVTSTSTHPATTHKPTTYAPTSTKPVTSAQPTTSASSGGSGPVFTGGQATFYTQDGTTGACGIKHGDYDLIVAADSLRYGDMSKVSDLCGKQVLITNTANGKQVTCTIADACPGCSNQNSLDLSLGAFDAIGNRDDGVLPITWKVL